MSKNKNKDATDSKPSQPVESNQGIFVIQRLFTKGVSFDAPQLSDLFRKEWKPKLDVNIQSNNQALPDNMHEVSLNVTVNGKMDEQAIFTMGATQAGIFTIQNFTPEQVELILGTECLKILFPYVREAITDLTSRATLPQFYLTPINFDAVYSKQLQERNK